MTAASPQIATVHVKPKTGIRWSRVLLHGFLFTMGLMVVSVLVVLAVLRRMKLV